MPRRERLGACASPLIPLVPEARTLSVHACEKLITTLVLLPSLDLRSDETDLIHTRSVRDVDHIGDVEKGNIIVTLHEHHFFRTGFEDIGQTALQIIPGRIFLIDLHTRGLAGSMVDELNNNRTVGCVLLFLIRRWWLGNQR